MGENVGVTASVDDTQCCAELVDLDPYEDRAAAVLDGVGNEFTGDQRGIIDLVLIGVVQEAGKRTPCSALRGWKPGELDVAVIQQLPEALVMDQLGGSGRQPRLLMIETPCGAAGFDPPPP